MKRKIVLTFMILINVLFVLSCKQTENQKLDLTEEVTFTKEGVLQLLNADETVLKELEIEVADNDYERATGLMYRKQMREDRGMLFIMEQEKVQSFYMKNTEIALDIIYINSAKEIVSIAENAKPHNETSLFSEGPAKYVLEINAGLSKTWGLVKGGKVSWQIQQ